MTRAHDSGILTSVHAISGMKSIFMAVPFLPMIEIVWSMPPHAVPAILSAVMVKSASYYYGILLRTPFEWAVVMAEHTVNAELELRPAAGGTFESIKILRPHGLATCDLMASLCANIALYPHKK